MSARAALAGLLCVAAPPAQRPPATELAFAFWNVENLFDTADDPANGMDDEFLPANGWTAERYALKLERLAEVIAELAPHVVGFAEVENRRVLDDLFAQPRLAPLGFAIAHRDSPDSRGIDCALAFRAPFELAGEGAVALHPFELQGRRPTRGVLEVALVAGDAPLTVLVNHWPSRGGDRDGSYRAAAAAAVRGLVDRVVAAAGERAADVLIVGDLNDDPFDRSVVEVLGAVRSRNAALHRDGPPVPLFNPSWALLGTSDLGTIYYNREWRWNVFDQAIVSRGLLDEVGFAYVDGSFGVFAPDRLRDHYRRPRWFRKRRGRDEWDTGYSDHFPVHGRLRWFAAAGR